MRMAPNRIPKVALHWTPHGKRKRGRPRTTWRRTITSQLEEMGFFYVSGSVRYKGQGKMPYVPSGMMRISM